MKHTRIDSARILCCTLILACSFSGRAGFIHVKEHQLVDGNDRSLRLNAVNLGGWLLWEGWIWGGKFKQESLMKRKMAGLYGKEQAEKYSEAYYNSFITAEDIKAIAGLGMNSVRLPVNHALFEKDEEPGIIRPGGFKYIDSVVAWCRRYKLYVIIDLHSAPGGQSPFFISDPDKNNLWKDPKNKTRTITVWKALAERYKNEEWVGGYDLLNEPIPGNDDELLQLYKDLVAAVRTVDNNHLLIIEGKAFATKFDFFTGPLDNNQIFSFHFYTWFTADPAKKLEQYHRFAQRVNVPVWCGEWGEDKVEKIKSNLALLNSSAYHFCGSAFWTWKRTEKVEGRPPLNCVALSTESAALVKWLTGAGDRPDTTSAKKGMEDFLNAISHPIMNEELKKVLQEGNKS